MCLVNNRIQVPVNDYLYWAKGDNVKRIITIHHVNNMLGGVTDWELTLLK